MKRFMLLCMMLSVWMCRFNIEVQPIFIYK